MGELDETAALDCGRVVWPTMVLADKLPNHLGPERDRGRPAIIAQGEPPTVIHAGRYTTTEWFGNRSDVLWMELAPGFQSDGDLFRAEAR